MGFRFRKSIKLFPGFKINISKEGVSSVSIGSRGVTLNAGKHGTRATIGIPGTGISYSEQLSSASDEDAQKLEPVTPSVNHPVKTTSSIGIESIKTFLILALSLMIIVLLLK